MRFFLGQVEPFYRTDGRTDQPTDTYYKFSYSYTHFFSCGLLTCAKLCFYWVRSTICCGHSPRTFASTVCLDCSPRPFSSTVRLDLLPCAFAFASPPLCFGMLWQWFVFLFMPFFSKFFDESLYLFLTTNTRELPYGSIPSRLIPFRNFFAVDCSDQIPIWVTKWSVIKKKFKKTNFLPRFAFISQFDNGHL